ncbi:5-methylcytosine-specific restriction endonuclease system specificity protein McrC [Rhizobium ruizarguesonis]|uniref:5-methylcytosine-specific restriction endonuclease system specificity protein McrC n=1 Tax=Rhizobium ruizarguesonis TaxID=2081791 RepID=UPI001A99772C|nr:5-methylcytosine-specific restriction endonuclease system specificity protein McrC [Rhizobium ruizarguesonis]MBY5889747.1 5-methylcytosine-specific restriction endonuclease system specificity protein McrC [Rhizobium leguminosarum]QSZ01546.1 5-methylcytosine-specific restriction endonuclease system specificity protein McrC [Rhizobium ruizarguesonis]
MPPAIPIENVYYLFCYAWNRFEDAQSLPVGAEASPNLPNLLARVLLSGMRKILRRGLDRDYRYERDVLPTVRGRIELGETLRLQARRIRRLQCEFDELSHDLLHNQILKASIKRLARASMIDRRLAHELAVTVRLMPYVSDIRLDRSAFSRVSLHRNNSHYQFLLKVAELAFDCLLPNHDGTDYLFHDVTRDERKMAAVFERFVRNFYRVEQQSLSVEPLNIKWDATRIAGSAARLPSMRVDVFLRSANRRIILDTKYYVDALQTYYNAESFRSENLYQLFAYLRNAAGSDNAFAKTEGILLYPRVGVSLDEAFMIQGHSVKIATIDLSMPWKEIRERLLKILAPLQPEAE